MQLSYNPAPWPSLFSFASKPWQVFAKVAGRIANLREAPVTSSASLRMEPAKRRSSGAGLMFLTEARRTTSAWKSMWHMAKKTR